MKEEGGKEGGREGRKEGGSHVFSLSLHDNNYNRCEQAGDVSVGLLYDDLTSPLP